MHSLETMQRLNEGALHDELVRAERDAERAERIRQYQAVKRFEKQLHAELVEEINSIEGNTVA